MKLQTKNTVIRILAALALVLQVSVPPLHAEFRPLETAKPGTVPTGMNYQGRLEKDGFPVTGSQSMEFTLYDAITGGTALWTSGAMTITVTQGVFSALLSIPTVALNGTSQRYLEVSVESITLAPRDPIRTVPYAAIAETVEGDIDISTAGLNFNVGSIAALVISSITSNVGVGTANPGAQFTVVPQASNNIIVNISSQNATAIMVVNSQGQMGLGTSSPSSLIDARSVGSAVLTLQADSDSNTANDDAGIILQNHGGTQVGQLIYDESASVVTMGYGANQHISIDSAGDVGIGTTNPGNDLTVRPAAIGEGIAVRESDDGNDAAKLTANATEGLFQLYEGGVATVQISPDTGGTLTYFTGGNVGVGTTGPGNDFTVKPVGAGEGIAVRESDDGNDAVKVTADATQGLIQMYEGGVLRTQISPDTGGTLTYFNGGNVGVKTATPFADFDVEGTAQFGANGFKSTFTATGDLQLNSGAGLALGTTFFVGNGRVGVGTVSPQTKLHMDEASGGANILQITNTDTGATASDGVVIGLNAADNFILGTQEAARMEFYTNGIVTPDMAITNAGDVGIGTISPQAKLEVVGSAQFGSAVTMSTFTAAGALNMGAPITMAANQGIGLSGTGGITIAGTGKATQAAAPTAANDLTNKTYVDSAVGGISFWSRDAATPNNLSPLTITDELGIGTALPATDLHVLGGGTAGTPAPSASAVAVFQNSAAAATDVSVDIISGAGAGATATLNFGDTAGAERGSIQYDNNGDTLGFGTAGTPNRMTISNTGAVTVTGAIAMGTNKITGLAAATGAGEAVRYNEFNPVLTTANAALARTGGTMTGAIAMGGSKITGLGAATVAGDAVRYNEFNPVLTTANAALARTGGTMSGAIAMGSSKITGLASGTASGDALQFGQILTFDSTAYGGGAASAPLIVTGILASDTILAVTQKTAGANNTPITSFSGLGANSLTIGWTADPGAGAIVTVAVLR